MGAKGFRGEDKTKRMAPENAMCLLSEGETIEKSMEREQAPFLKPAKFTL